MALQFGRFSKVREVHRIPVVKYKASTRSVHSSTFPFQESTKKNTTQGGIDTASESMKYGANKFADSTANMTESIKNTTESIKGTASEYGSKIEDYVANAAGTTKEQLENKATTAKEEFEGMLKTATDVDERKDIGKKIAKEVLHKVKDLDLTLTATTVINKIAGAVDAAVIITREAMNIGNPYDEEKYIKRKYKKDKTSENLGSEGKETISTETDEGKAKDTAAVNTTGGVIEKAKKKAGDIKEQAKETLQEATDTIKDKTRDTSPRATIMSDRLGDAASMPGIDSSTEAILNQTNQNISEQRPPPQRGL